MSKDKLTLEDIIYLSTLNDNILLTKWLEELENTIKHNPNDFELGRKIRLLSENINEEVFQPNNLVWQNITTEADWERRDAHTAVVFKDKMWVLGGVGGDYPAYNETKNDDWASNDGKTGH